jgi:hypothetical protein
MAYQHKIDWSDPRKGSDIVGFTLDRFKTAVLDYHIQIEGELEDIIRMAFRDPDKFKINGFSRKVDLVQALIGKTPDDQIWSLVDKLADLRHEYAHGTPSPKTVQKYIGEIQNQLQKIRPDYIIASSLDERLDILGSAHFTVRRFFREIKEWLEQSRSHA